MFKGDVLCLKAIQNGKVLMKHWSEWGARLRCAWQKRRLHNIATRGMRYSSLVGLGSSLASAALRATQHCFSASAALGATRREDARPEDPSAQCPLSASAAATAAAALVSLAAAAASSSALFLSSWSLLAASSACSYHPAHLDRDKNLYEVLHACNKGR